MLEKQQIHESSREASDNSEELQEDNACDWGELWGTRARGGEAVGEPRCRACTRGHIFAHHTWQFCLLRSGWPVAELRAILALTLCDLLSTETVIARLHRG